MRKVEREKVPEMSDTISYHKLNRLTEGKDEMHARAIEVAARDINSAEESIRRGLADIEWRCEQVAARLAARQHLNSLGEFQRTPVEVDQAIARREQAWQMLGLILSEEEVRSLMATAERGE